MRLAVSNIAWTAAEDPRIAPALRAAGASAIEVAPGRVFADVASATAPEAQAWAADWRMRGLPVISMQALLFGRPDLHLFGSGDDPKDLIAYLAHVISLSGALGCGPLVFGSPRNRLKGALDFGAARDRAVPVFRALGDACAEAGTVLCLEANAIGYGCDFMTGLSEAAEVVRAVDHPRVGLVADTGNMIMAAEPAAAILPVLDLVRHVHVSAPRLGPVTDHANHVTAVLAHLSAQGYAGDITLEMLPPPAEAPQTVLGTVRWLAGLIGAQAAG